MRDEYCEVKEYKVGEVFDFDCGTYKVVKADPDKAERGVHCEDCAFGKTDFYDTCYRIPCVSIEREDETDVVYKEV